ncbi:MAG: hypothetical protein Faunusvirus44_8 [Faunusvirus sp.]|jgi:hypothetical protein|uniref:Uncharacterized protein n=1 Tax=Faunusvirus sp. TaxID=2487766 RepID=A0A3G4ZXV5_9VIRU|nr:MAG: hypothetical protein Faunusvirus44_8 [Faunusvirus sp.]
MKKLINNLFVIAHTIYLQQATIYAMDKNSDEYRFNKVKQFLNKHDYLSTIIEKQHIGMLYNLFVNDIIGQPIINLMNNTATSLDTSALEDTKSSVIDPDILVVHAVYYNIKEDNVKKLKLLHIAANMKNIRAIVDLETHYGNIEEYDKMDKYYKMAIEIDPTYHIATNNYAYFLGKQKRRDDMYKYLLKAVELGSIIALHNMAYYYGEDDNIDNMIKFGEQAVNKGCIDSMMLLADHYDIIADTANMTKYYKMAAELGNCSAMNKLGQYYKKHVDFKNMNLYFEQALRNENFDFIHEVVRYHKKNNTIFDCLNLLLELLDNAVPADDIEILNEHICSILSTNSKVAVNFFTKYNELTKTVREQEQYIDHLELLPEGPKYTAAKAHFNELASIDNF